MQAAEGEVNNIGWFGAWFGLLVCVAGVKIYETCSYAQKKIHLHALLIDFLYTSSKPLWIQNARLI